MFLSTAHADRDVTLTAEAADASLRELRSRGIV
jgi:hypothetical protein